MFGPCLCHEALLPGAEVGGLLKRGWSLGKPRGEDMNGSSPWTCSGVASAAAVIYASTRA